MTSDDYARLVRKMILDAKKTSAHCEYDQHLRWAYDELAKGAVQRVLGTGRRYELDDNTQGFERREIADALIECRAEALDVPAYLTQVAHLMGLGSDPDISRGIEHAAELILILDRLARRATDGE